MDKIIKHFEYDSINSCNKLLIDNKIFYINYKLNRYCALCNYNLEINELYNPYITMDEEDLNSNLSIESRINTLLAIENFSCPNCYLIYFKKK